MLTRCGTWLLGFGCGLVGGLLGPVSARYQAIITSCLLVCMGLFWVAKKRWALLCLAAAWGFHFNPPVLGHQGAGIARVVRQGTLLPKASHVIVTLPNGGEMQAKGHADVEVEGRVRCVKRVWFFEACRFRALFDTSVSARHPFERSVELLRSSMLEALARLDRFERSWLMALVMGDETDLQPSVREDFKKTGLYHLLVVSGFHFTILCRLLELFVSGPFQLCYVVGMIRARLWVRLSCVLRVIILLCAFLYGLLVGFQAPCQRALLGFAIHILEPLFHGRATLWKRLQWTAVLQSVLFPGGFASVSNFLSWGAYVFVVATIVRARSFVQKLALVLILQLKLLVLSFALIGKASLIGIAANILIAPVFPLIFIGGLIRLVHGDAIWTFFIARAETMFVRLVRTVAERSEVGLINASSSRQMVLLGASLLLFLHALWRIQNPLDGRRRGCYPRESGAFMKGGRNGKTLGRENDPHR